MKSKIELKSLVLLAIFSALAYVVMVLVRIPVMPAAPFLKLDVKDVIITTGGFIFGPLASLAMSFVVSFLEMITVSESGPIGFLMNMLSTCAFACPAALIYKRKRTIAGAVAGLLSGVVLMTAVMLLWNYLIAPLYMTVSRAEVVTLLWPVFLPFNLLKGGINAAMTMLLYKPVVTALRKSNMLPQEGAARSRRGLSIGVMITTAVILLTCVLIVLALRGAL